MTVIQYCPRAIDVIRNLFKKDNVVINDVGTKFSFIFYFLARGKFKIYYAKDNMTGEIVFHSVVYSKSFKFRFMRKGDYQIAHCFTRETHRGKNIYPYVLKYIVDKEEGNAVMFIKDGNEASEHGVVKAGFVKYGGGCYSKKFFKNILYVEEIIFCFRRISC